MGMSVKDFRQLEKLMLMTTSDVDAEALSALRMANNILKRYGYTWTSAFKRLIKVEEIIEADPDEGRTLTEARRKVETDEAREINQLFEDVDRHVLNPGESSFVESLREQFERRNSLSPKQKEALERIANR